MSTASAVRHLPELAELLASQDSVATRQQLALQGICSDDIRNQVQARRWTTVGRKVVVLHSGPLTAAQQQWVAVLQQSSGAALAGITAAQADGLRWLTPEKLHVIVPIGSRIVPAAGVVVHASRTYAGPPDQHPVRRPPRTRIERSVIDAAAWAPNDRRACGALCAAAQQGLTTAGAMLGALAAAGRVSRRHLLGLTLADIEGGADSLAEIDMGLLATQAGLWTPIRQAVRLDSDGRRRYLDNDFGSFEVEVDGALHLLPDSYWGDMHRQNELTLGGARILRFPTIAIRLEPQRVIAQLRRAGELFPDDLGRRACTLNPAYDI
jgi:hypothetical protein